MEITRIQLIRLLSVFACISLMGYFALDSKLYYQGKNTFAYNTLPLKIKPQYWGYDQGNLGFILVDEWEMTLVAPGNRYFSSNIEISKVLKYGYNDNKLIALVYDTTGKKYYIECAKNDDTFSKQEIKITVTDENLFKTDLTKYKWIEVQNTSYKSFEIMRNWLVLIIIITVIMLIATYMKGNSLIIVKE